MITKEHLQKILSDTESYHIEKTVATDNMDKFSQAIVNRFSRGVYRVQKELEENGKGKASFDFSLITAFRVVEPISTTYFEEGFGEEESDNKSGESTDKTPIKSEGLPNKSEKLPNKTPNKSEGSTNKSTDKKEGSTNKSTNKIEEEILKVII